ncbi:MAG: PLP-dependent transferase [Acidimicrobiales bacterium]
MPEPTDPTADGAPLPPPAPETVAITAGRTHNGAALAPVLWGSSTFVSPDAASAFADATSIGSTGFYSRYGNPTVADFEEAVAALEGAEAARAFGSGMGAVCAVVLGLCSTGDHIVSQRQLYAGTQLLLQSVCPRFGIDVTFVDGIEPGARRRRHPGQDHPGAGRDPGEPAPRPRRPRRARCHRRPHHRRRLDVRHAHAAAAAGPRRRPGRALGHQVDRRAQRRHPRRRGGAPRSSSTGCGASPCCRGPWRLPFDAMNGLRGIRTLGVRMQRQCSTAGYLAERLVARPDVAEVRYPGLPDHPQHELARRQMRGFGGMICFDVAGGRDGGRAFVEATRVARLASSLGGPETLVTHPASTTHVNLLPDELAASHGAGRAGQDPARLRQPRHDPLADALLRRARGAVPHRTPPDRLIAGPPEAWPVVDVRSGEGSHRIVTPRCASVTFGLCHTLSA